MDKTLFTDPRFNQLARTLVVTLILFLLTWYAPLYLSLLKPVAKSYFKFIDPPRNQLSTEDHLRYDRLAITAPLNITPQSSPLKVADWDQIGRTLRQGVNLSYEGKTWEESQYVYAIGHSSDVIPHRYGAIFAPLGQAEIGDTFIIQIDKQAFTFLVDNKFLLDPFNQAAWQDLKQDNKVTRQLTVVTCWPLLSTKYRLVLTARQI